MVQPREEAPEPARDARGPRDDGKCLHSAPLLEVRDAPDGNLLEAHDVGAVVVTGAGCGCGLSTTMGAGAGAGWTMTGWLTGWLTGEDG